MSQVPSKVSRPDGRRTAGAPVAGHPREGALGGETQAHKLGFGRAGRKIQCDGPCVATQGGKHMTEKRALSGALALWFDKKDEAPAAPFPRPPSRDPPFRATCGRPRPMQRTSM